MAKMSAVEKELQKATKVTQGGSTRQAYFKKLEKAAADLEDDKWGALSKEAQNWVNAATKAFNADKDYPDFAIEEDDDDADEPVPKKKRRDDDEDDEPAPKKKGKPADEDEDEPAPKKKGRAKPADDEDDEPAPKKKRRGDDDEDEPAPKKKAKDKEKPARASGPVEVTGIKFKIKKLVIGDPSISVDDLMTKLGKEGKMSKVTVSNVRAEFRHSLRVLQQLGHLKNLEV